MTELAQVIVVMAIPAALFGAMGYLNRRWDRVATACQETSDATSRLH